MATGSPGCGVRPDVPTNNIRTYRRFPYQTLTVFSPLHRLNACTYRLAFSKLRGPGARRLELSKHDLSRLAADVTIGDGVHLHPRVTAEAGVAIGARAIFVDDGVSRTILREGAQIGAGTIIGAGVEIGHGAELRPGAVALATVPSHAILEGNPAQVVGYVRGAGRSEAPHFPVPVADDGPTSAQPLGVGASELYRMRRVSDLRGALTVGEMVEELPFVPKRYFIVFDVPSRELRGEHAHKACHQFLICVHGSCTILLDDGKTRRELTLDRPDLGVYMPPLIWGTQYKYSADAVLLAFASLPYDPDDYIRSYEEFLRAVRKGRR